jgi:hypothetical protein
MSVAMPTIHTDMWALSKPVGWVRNRIPERRVGYLLGMNTGRGGSPDQNRHSQTHS